MKFVFKKISKNLISLLIILGLVIVSKFVFAADFGTNAVNNGLNGALSSGDPREMIGRIINIALGLLGVIAFGIIIYGGFVWMTSGANDEKISTAKKILQNGIIGLIIVLSAWGIATFLISKLSGATQGPLYCSNGATLSCGCGGYMVCESNAWGGCIGSDCSGGNVPSSCDSNPNPGCQAVQNICANTDYCDNSDCSCKTKGNLGDPCDGDLNTPTCEADNNKCAEFLTCDKNSCICKGSPIITSISPMGGFCEDNINKSCINDSDCSTTCNTNIANGAPGNFITIFGNNFNSYDKNNSKVIFLGNNNPKEGINVNSLNKACVNSWQDDQIIIAVPADVHSGSIKVITKDNLSDQTDDDQGPVLPDFVANNIIRSGLCFLTPQEGGLTSPVNYQGVNLYSGTAYFGNYNNNVRGLNSTFSNPNGLEGSALVPNIKSGDSGTFVSSNINGNEEKSNFLYFRKVPEEGDGPYIVSFSPLEGSDGQYVTILGSGFGGARGNNHVYFSTTEASYDFPAVCANSVWSDKQIIVKVPKGISKGSYNIRVSLDGDIIDTTKNNPSDFKVDSSLDLKTSLCKIDPNRGPANSETTLYGEYFGIKNSQGLVQFSPNIVYKGTIIKDDDGSDSILTTVPQSAITGPAKVIKNSTWGNELNFEVGSCEVNADCGVQTCCPQNTYKKGQCVNDISDCFINIPTSVFEWGFNTGYFNGGGDSSNDCVLTPNCANVGTTISDHDAACNCDNNGGKYCDINNDHPGGICTDCSGLSSQSLCNYHRSVCCYDAKQTPDASDDTCSGGSGKIISNDPNNSSFGYCAYYNCGDPNTIPPEDPQKCASSNPLKIGVFKEIESCNANCSNDNYSNYCSTFNNQQDSCIAESSCCYDNDSNRCYGGERISGGQYNGYCTYYNCQDPDTDPPGDPAQCNSNSLISGAYSTIQTCTATCANGGEGSDQICGCTSDQECGDEASMGCGADGCCQFRPNVINSFPANNADNVCRNAVIKIDFDQTMYANSMANDILLLEERDYGNGVCPIGTFLTDIKGIRVDKTSLLSRLSDRVKSFIHVFDNSVLADEPNPNKLYCALPGLVSEENTGNISSLVFTPKKLLSPSTNYYFIIKGDENLNSQSGVLSSAKIGLNGTGLDIGGGAYKEGSLLLFNNKKYINSHIISFFTLSDQGSKAGICTVNNVLISPSSYLFNRSDNDINEDDSPGSDSFDTIADRDKVFTSRAYSSDGQILHPITGYYWTWDYSVDSNIVSLLNTNKLGSNKVFVNIDDGLTDTSTKLWATINMSNFLGESCSNDPNCVCNDNNCSNHCCNSYLDGNNKTNYSDIYIFICNNPWPMVNGHGNWYPWIDNCDSAIGSCDNYNYKFYYCRDAGKEGTSDDLPAINNNALIKGQGATLLCSADKSVCSSLGTSCGPDKDGDGLKDGVCVRSILKESYFFRENILSKAVLKSVIDDKTGGKLNIFWKSPSNQVSLYKIYYNERGSSEINNKNIKIGDACTISNSVASCTGSLTGLLNNHTYVIKISVISNNNTESSLSNGKYGVPTDQIPPDVPTNFKGNINNNSITFIWDDNQGSGGSLFHRLYRGISSEQYGESFDSQNNATSITLNNNKFSPGVNYFALSGIDASGNESNKSAEFKVNIP